MPFFAVAQSTELSGGWKELRRSANSGEALEFTDTIKINFLVGGEYTWMKRGSLMYRGTYKLNEGLLNLGMREFTLIDHNDSRMVLKDDGATYEFQSYAEPARTKLAPEPEPLPVTGFSMMAGDWETFKRTSSRNMSDIDYTTMVQRANITETPDANGNYGYLAAPRERTGSRRMWNIKRFENGMLYTSGPTERVFEVIKAEKELILKEGDITYFFKVFR
jgi:hypothetical protein